MQPVLLLVNGAPSPAQPPSLAYTTTLSLCTYHILQDKYQQKVHFTSNNVPVAPFQEIPDQAALDKAVTAFGYPIILKSKR